MMRKMLAVTFFAAGYVAGAAAGRERYEQIRRVVLGVAKDPVVQHLASEANDLAHQQVATVADKLTGTHQAEQERLDTLDTLDVETSRRL